jgi:hypothetical protein
MTKKNLSSLKGLEVPDHRNGPRIIRKVGIEIPGYMNGPKINLGTGKGLDYLGTLMDLELPGYKDGLELPG